MLHVFFLILKIILILLAAVLGIVLLLLLLVLFVPVRYRAYARKKGEEILAEAKLSWLLHFVSIPVSFQNGVLSVKLKIAGFTVMNLDGEEEPEAERKKKTEREQKDSFVPDERKEAKSEQMEEPGVSLEAAADESQIEEPEKSREESGKALEEAEREAESESGFWEDLRRFFKMIWNFFRGFFLKLKNLKCTFQRFCDKIKRMAEKYQEMKAFALDERTKAAVRLVWKQAGILMRQVLPKKISGDLHFGTSDPALTGQILGAIGIFYPLFMDNVKVEPDFERAVLEGELFLKGRLRMASVVRIAWRLFRDRNVRYVYRRFTSD